VAITVDHTGAVAAAFDATATLPAYWDQFWTTVQSTGNDMRVTQADGVTPVTKFDLNGFNSTTKVGTLEIQDTAGGQASLLYWLYWGDSTLASGITPFVPASAKSAYIDLGAPARGFAVTVQPQQRMGDTTPITEVAKDPDSTIFVWFDFGPMMQRRAQPQQGSTELECISYATVSATGGTATASATRFEGGSDRHTAVKVKFAGGTTANDYILTVTATTTEGRVLLGKAKVKVRAMA